MILVHDFSPWTPHLSASTPRDTVFGVRFSMSRHHGGRMPIEENPRSLLPSSKLFPSRFLYEFGPRGWNAASLPALAAVPVSVTLCTAKWCSGISSPWPDDGKVANLFFTVWGAYASFPASFPPLPITLLARCEIAESLPNQIFCFRLQCCQLLTEITSRSGTSFSCWREKSPLFFQ
jgi:hypothetical protein